MDLTVEALVAAGIPEATAQKIVESHKAAQSSMVDKAKFDEANKALETAKTDLAARDKQLGELKPLADKGSELETKIAALEQLNKDQASKSKKDLEDFRKRTAIQAALQGKAKDADIVFSLIDADKVSVDEKGTVTGLTEQVERLTKEKGFLFEQPEDSGEGSGGSAQFFQPVGNPPPSGSAPKQGAGKPKPGDLGKKLAETAAAQAAATKKSNDHYFGGK